jgi:hypothetical protein
VHTDSWPYCIAIVRYRKTYSRLRRKKEKTPAVMDERSYCSSQAVKKKTKKQKKAK